MPIVVDFCVCSAYNIITKYNKTSVGEVTVRIGVAAVKEWKHSELVSRFYRTKKV